MQPLAVTIQGAVKAPDSPGTACSAEESWAPVPSWAQGLHLEGCQDRRTSGAWLSPTVLPEPAPCTVTVVQVLCYCLTFCLRSAILLFIRSYLQRTQLGIQTAPCPPPVQQHPAEARAGRQCGTVARPAATARSRLRPREWTPSRLQSGCTGRKGSWVGSSGALSAR